MESVTRALGARLLIPLTGEIEAGMLVGKGTQKRIPSPPNSVAAESGALFKPPETSNQSRETFPLKTEVIFRNMIFRNVATRNYGHEYRATAKRWHGEPSVGVRSIHSSDSFSVGDMLRRTLVHEVQCASFCLLKRSVQRRTKGDHLTRAPHVAIVRLNKNRTVALARA